MRISELSQASGVPVATIKYYLREGLLHEGQLTSATQAQYDQSHLARLRLVRALLGAGGLSVAAAGTSSTGSPSRRRPCTTCSVRSSACSGPGSTTRLTLGPQSR
jgi:DNA-binding transcriptional MerR regulator